MESVDLRHDICLSYIKHHWKQVRCVPQSSSGWDSAEDKLQGTEEYGDPTDNTKAWAIKFNQSSKLKVEILGKSHKPYVGKMSDE